VRRRREQLEVGGLVLDARGAWSAEAPAKKLGGSDRRVLVEQACRGKLGFGGFSGGAVGGGEVGEQLLHLLDMGKRVLTRTPCPCDAGGARLLRTA
jgi:hypothetical protein